jgi:cytochrome P450
MTEPIAPKPTALTRKLSPLQRLIKGRHSSLSVLYERSYSMHMGEFWTPFRNIYFVNQPDLVDRVLTKESARFPKSNLMSSMLSLLLGDGIFVSNGELWEKQRRMLDPAFNQARIQDVFPLMRDAADGMVERLSQHPEGEVLNIEEETTHVTADIIFRTIFSRPLGRDEAARIFRAFSRFQEIVHAQGVWAMAGLPAFSPPGGSSPPARTGDPRLAGAGRSEPPGRARVRSAAGERRDILASLLQRSIPPQATSSRAASLSTRSPFCSGRA